MGAFEYLLLLVAVILGLALSDLAISVHRLLNAANRVRWDALPLLAAILAFVRIVTQWWGWYRGDKVAQGLTFAMFLGILGSSALLFLMAAAALPDEIETGGVDLKAYYLRVSRRYWTLFALQWSLMNGVLIWAQMSVLKARFDPFSPGYLILPAALVLAYVRNRALHLVGLLGFLTLYVVLYSGQTLT